jgi:hypothetical protein
LYPSDATSTAALVAAMARNPGISYIRTTRRAYPVIYGAREEFAIGGSKVLRSSEHDDVTLALPPSLKRRPPRPGGSSWRRTTIPKAGWDRP